MAQPPRCVVFNVVDNVVVNVVFNVVSNVVVDVVVNVVVSVVVNVMVNVMVNVVVNVAQSLSQWSYSDLLGPTRTYDDLRVPKKTALISTTFRLPCPSNHTVPSRA